MVDVGVHRLTRTRLGRAVYDALDALGVTGTSMYVFAVELDAADVDREPPDDVAVEVVRASELSPRPDEDFADLAPSDFVVLARDAAAPSADELRECDADAVRGWAFLTLERPVEVTELAATVRFDGAYLWDLYVDPADRGRGLGSALLARALSFAAEDRVDAAYALVAKDNAPSRRAFEARGFAAVDEVAYYRAFAWERRHGPLHGDREYSL
ncbi:GNAT family N-acetyltransferase [Halorubellus sp. PRR65]|uniref:GNAT family N-acetyltransferase n=1 Tax=Halorubellus sp. PRR65 TaxID=3098148 RepID=UPI002B264056|nr:GNAT family N-acetyltransferase [Halorubellus sp. PRR65]